MKAFADFLLRRSLIPLGVAIWLIAPARAQDRTISVREVDVVPRKGELDVLPDGGCTFTAYVTVVAPSVEPAVSHSAFNVSDTPFCVTGKAKIVLAGKKDLQVGTGAAP